MNGIMMIARPTYEQSLKAAKLLGRQTDKPRQEHLKGIQVFLFILGTRLSI